MKKAVLEKIQDSLKSGGAEFVSAELLRDVKKDLPEYSSWRQSRQGAGLRGVKECIQVEWKKRGFPFTTLIHENLAVILAINMDVDEKSHTLASLASYTLGKMTEPGQHGIRADSFCDARHYLEAGAKDVYCYSTLYRDLEDFRREEYQRSGG